MSKFILDSKSNLEAKKQPINVRFTFQTSNFELPTEPNTEVFLVY